MPLFPRLHEVFRLLAPAERAGVIGIVVLNVALDRRNALLERAEDRVLEPLPRELGEETLDGIHPRGRGRSEVKRPIGVVLQPFVDLGRLVGGNVVEHDMNLGSRPDPLGDEIKEGEEFLRAVTLDHLAGDLSGGDIKGRHQAGGAVAPVVVSAGLGMAGLHRQGRLRPSQCLDLCLLVHRDDDSVVGRVDVEADDVADLQLEPRVAGDLECLDPVGFQAVVLQDAEARRDMLEVIEARCKRRSTIVASQLPVEEWHRSVGEDTIADAILDRLVHFAHHIELSGDSMRRSRKPLPLERSADRDGNG